MMQEHEINISIRTFVDGETSQSAIRKVLAAIIAHGSRLGKSVPADATDFTIRIEDDSSTAAKRSGAFDIDVFCGSHELRRDLEP